MRLLFLNLLGEMEIVANTTIEATKQRSHLNQGQNLVEVFEQKKIVIVYSEHKMEMAEEYNGIIDCLQKVKDFMINTVSHLQEAENKLYAASCTQGDDSEIQTAQNASRETDVCFSEGEAIASVQASCSPTQKSQRSPSLNRTESQNMNQIQPSETKTVEKDIVASSAENVSAGEQDVSREPPMKKENGEHRLLLNSVTEKKDCNGKDKPHGGSSVTEKSPELAFQDATSSSEGIVPGTLKEIYDITVTNIFEHKKKAVVKESSKGVESEEHRLTEQMEDSKMETNHEICRNDLITFTSSAQTCDLTTVNPSTNDSEEIKKSRHWMYKEFLVGKSSKNECEVACFIKAPATALENLKCKIVNDASSLVVDDSEELVSNVICIECSDYEKTIPFPINIAIPFTSCFRGNYREIMVKVTDRNFQSNYLTPISLEGFQGNHKVQPIEPSLVSTLKARHDMYYSVVSTSALVYVQHPSAQPFHSSFTITLPCPPNPEKKRQGDEREHARALSATVKRVATAYHPCFVVIRLSFLLENTYLLLFAHALEEAVCSTMANVILYRKRENPYEIVVLLSASKDLTWELQNLHEEGYFGPPEPTQQFSLREGEQIHFRFRGNIFASEALWDNLLYWLAEELAEDNTSLLALCLPVRRSVLQLVRLKCPDNLTHQIYELLCCWKKSLPRSADKQQLLSRYLRKSGRSDLSEELRFKWQYKAFA
ncbi:death domain-containing protein 1 [Grus japonensis]|uniref:Death domain-containing protein 1 n=1 Tax=Grus japonensis TaxID=30415 RepID=A0ABC9WSL3_GRUJA